MNIYATVCQSSMLNITKQTENRQSCVLNSGRQNHNSNVNKIQFSFDDTFYDYHQNM